MWLSAVKHLCRCDHFLHIFWACALWSFRWRLPVLCQRAPTKFFPNIFFKWLILLLHRVQLGKKSTKTLNISRTQGKTDCTGKERNACWDRILDRGASGLCGYPRPVGHILHYDFLEQNFKVWSNGKCYHNMSCRTLELPALGMWFRNNFHIVHTDPCTFKLSQK